MSDYSAKDLQVMEGLDAVRKRPGMYIGSTGVRGLHQLLWEIVDNAVDEAANGYADEITVQLLPDNSVIVEDNGRGIPPDTHDKLGVSGVEVVFTQLHAGGKFDNHAYSYSGGLHGVGAAVVNALSEFVIVEVAVNGKLYRQEFKSFLGDDNKIHSGKPVTPLQEVGRTRKTGSKVHFLPDKRVFETLHMNYDTVNRRIRELAFLNKGIKFNLIDSRERGNRKEAYYCFEGGIADFVALLNTDKNTLYESPIVLSGKSGSIIVDIAIQHNDGYTDSVFSYVNNISTTEGGTHETGFKTAYSKVLNEYCRNNGLLKDKDASLQFDDFREGLTAVISLKMQNVQFEGQTKTKLGNTEARPAVEAVVTEQLTKFLEDLKNMQVSQSIAQKALAAAKAREAARKARNLARDKNKLENEPLVGKLASCIGRDYEINELFIVEGDSAGGSAKQGRDRRFQAILPLRGKPQNVEKKSIDEVLANEEYRSIITALGTSFGSNFDKSSLKYNKVIILSDADQDGAHIRAILLTFFYRYMKELILDGHVYIGLPPLYKVEYGKQVKYLYSDEELAAFTANLKDYSLQRYKGLGEMNPEQLWDTTMNPNNRSLLQVTIEDAAEAERRLTVLMGDKVEPRKEYIKQYADFDN
ncbi:MAG TPA: DNA gyrase subunit B [Clostridiales bacterium]|jgi:DNA gyrase subunit B|nr:DNA gyrase subunit B [Clostridiales bacterium]